MEIEQPTCHEIVCDRMVALSRRVVSLDGLASVEVTPESARSFVDRVFWATVLELRADVLAYLNSTEEVIEEELAIPSTWWQHLRKRLGWQWQRRFVPLKITRNYYRCCPHIAVKQIERHVRFLRDGIDSTELQLVSPKGTVTK